MGLSSWLTDPFVGPPQVMDSSVVAISAPISKMTAPRFSEARVIAVDLTHTCSASANQLWVWSTNRDRMPPRFMGLAPENDMTAMMEEGSNSSKAAP